MSALRRAHSERDLAGSCCSGLLPSVPPHMAYDTVQDKSMWTTFGAKSPDGYTWHHHQDLKTMQLPERIIHQLFGHRGGVSMLKD